MATRTVLRCVSAALVSLVLTGRVVTQEHAPTVDVCRADQAAWEDSQGWLDYAQQELKHERDGAKNKNPAAQLSYDELLLREIEMGTCMKVDPPKADEYQEVWRFYKEVESDKYHHFIERHHLVDQFLREDAAGLR